MVAGAEIFLRVSWLVVALLATGAYGSGRTLAWTSDIGPHWLPQAFAQWRGYPQLWRQALAWLARQS